MNRDDVIRMAWDAGVWIPMGSEREKCVDTLQRFAGLVAAAEREEFLKWCGVHIEGVTPKTDWAKGYVMALKNVAEGLRARSNQ